MAYSKPDFPGLLPEGLHPMALSGVRDLCVNGFPNSESRGNIMDSLEGMLQRLDDTGIPADIWIDGSFVTEKINPHDVDIVALIPGHVYNSGSTEIRETIEWVKSDDIYESHKVDGHVVPFFPKDDPMRPVTDDGIKYWLRVFGTYSQYKKGMPVLKVRGGAK